MGRLPRGTARRSGLQRAGAFPCRFVVVLDKRRLLTIGTSGFRRQVDAGQGRDNPGLEAQGRPALWRRGRQGGHRGGVRLRSPHGIGRG